MQGLVCLLTEITALLWVAIWNRYPILFYDTGWYLRSMLSGAPDDQKTPLYPMFMELSGGMVSLWAVAAAQAIIIWYVIATFWKTMGLERFRTATVLLLCATTSLSWEVSYIMPDMFTAVQILTLFLIAFHRQVLSNFELIILAVFYMFSTIVHHSNYLLSVSLLMLMFAAAWLWRVLPIRQLILPCVLTVLSLCVLASLNYMRDHMVYLSRSSHAYIVARMIEDGIVPRLLAEHCGEKHYVLCPYASVLPTGRTEFLFGRSISDYPIFEKIGGWDHSKEALMPIILDSLRYYPMENIRAAGRETLEQLWRFGIADFIFKFPPEQYVVKEMKVYSPQEYASWMASLQQQGSLKSYTIALFHQVMMACYVLLCIGMVWRMRKEELYRPIIQATGFVLVAILVNAAITGTFSHAEPRYESRLIWLIPLCVAAAETLRLSRQSLYRQK